MYPRKFLLTLSLSCALFGVTSLQAVTPNPAPVAPSSSEPKMTVQSVYAGYTLYTLRPAAGTSFSLNGFNVGYSIDFRLMKSHPLFAGTGITAAYTSRSKDFHEAANYNPVNGNVQVKFFNFTVPVNIGYELAIGQSDFSIIPQLGLDLRIQAYGHARLKSSPAQAGTAAAASGLYVRASGYNPGSYNLFSSRQLGNRVFNRVQAGWHASLKLRAHSMVLGLSYGSDFKKLRNELGSSNLLVNLGYYF